ncbi:MAG: hypothetical protein M3367_19900 [Acidobacteriota bacterium]|nr:hypothetical protein [Acidobacteriota bacterium]
MSNKINYRLHKRQGQTPCHSTIIFNAVKIKASAKKLLENLNGRALGRKIAYTCFPGCASFFRTVRRDFTFGGF